MSELPDALCKMVSALVGHEEITMLLNLQITTTDGICLYSELFVFILFSMLSSFTAVYMYLFSCFLLFPLFDLKQREQKFRKSWFYECENFQKKKAEIKLFTNPDCLLDSRILLFHNFGFVLSFLLSLCFVSFPFSFQFAPCLSLMSLTLIVNFVASIVRWIS